MRATCHYAELIDSSYRNQRRTLFYLRCTSKSWTVIQLRLLDPKYVKETGAVETHGIMNETKFNITSYQIIDHPPLNLKYCKYSVNSVTRVTQIISMD